MRYLDRWFGAEGGTRTPTSYLTRPSNVRVCQFRHFGIELSDNNYSASVTLQFPRLSARATYFCLAGDADCEAAGELAGELAGWLTGAVLAAGDGNDAGVGVASGAVVCKTE